MFRIVNTDHEVTWSFTIDFWVVERNPWLNRQMMLIKMQAWFCLKSNPISKHASVKVKHQGEGKHICFWLLKRRAELRVIQTTLELIIKIFNN
jgi:hypothetical protein